jgi:hypothetical protein
MLPSRNKNKYQAKLAAMRAQRVPASDQPTHVHVHLEGLVDLFADKFAASRPNSEEIRVVGRESPYVG